MIFLFNAFTMIFNPSISLCNFSTVTARACDLDVFREKIEIDFDFSGEILPLVLVLFLEYMPGDAGENMTRNIMNHHM